MASGSTRRLLIPTECSRMAQKYQKSSRMRGFVLGLSCIGSGRWKMRSRREEGWTKQSRTAKVEVDSAEEFDSGWQVMFGRAHRPAQTIQATTCKDGVESGQKGVGRGPVIPHDRESCCCKRSFVVVCSKPPLKRRNGTNGSDFGNPPFDILSPKGTKIMNATVCLQL
jgi:hypothetical protein